MADVDDNVSDAGIVCEQKPFLLGLQIVCFGLIKNVLDYSLSSTKNLSVCGMSSVQIILYSWVMTGCRLTSTARDDGS